MLFSVKRKCYKNTGSKDSVVTGYYSQKPTQRNSEQAGGGRGAWL